MCASSVSSSSEFDSSLQFVSELTDLQSRLSSSYHLEDLGVDCYKLGDYVYRLAQKVLDHAQVVMQSGWQESIKAVAVESVAVESQPVVSQVDFNETISMKMSKGRYYKRFDDYEDKFTRISKKEFFDSLREAVQLSKLIFNEVVESINFQYVVYAN